MYLKDLNNLFEKNEKKIVHVIIYRYVSTQLINKKTR